MPGFLKQSTASQSRALGPFVDDTDFKTAETALTINNTDIKLVVNGGASANKNSGGGTHRVNGVYGVTFDATDTATVGELEVSVVVAGALPVFDKFFVIEEAVFDALFGAAAAGYQVPIWAAAGSTVNLSATTIKTATDVETDTADIQTRLPAALVSGRMDSSTGAMEAGVVTAAAIATDAIDADALAADAVTEIQSGLSTLNAAGVRTAVGLASANLDTQLDALPTAAENADAVWDEAIAGHLGAGSTGLALNSAGAAGDPWSTALPGAYGAGTAGNIVGNGIDAAVSSRAAPGAAMALTSGERTTLAGVIWSTVMEGSRTAIQYMRGFGAALLGKASGMATTTAVFRDVDDTKPRITATVDADGNRTAITLDLT